MKYWFRNLRNKIAGDDRRHYTDREINQKASNKETLPTHVVLHADDYRIKMQNINAPNVTFESKKQLQFDNVNAKKIILKDSGKDVYDFDHISNCRISEITSYKNRSYLSVTNTNDLEKITTVGKGSLYLRGLPSLQHLYLENIKEIASIFARDLPKLESSHDLEVLRPDLEETFGDNMFEYLFTTDLKKKTKYDAVILVSTQNDICFMDSYKGTRQGLLDMFEKQKEIAQNNQRTQNSIDQEYKINLQKLDEKHQYQTETRTELLRRTDRNTTNVIIALNLTGFEYGA